MRGAFIIAGLFFGLWYSLSFGASTLSKVTFATSLPNNQARAGQRFSVVAGAESANSVVFSFYAATTSVKPVGSVFEETKTSCSSGCSSRTSLTAPLFSKTLYLWLDVTSLRESESRSLTVLVVGGAR